MKRRDKNLGVSLRPCWSLTKTLQESHLEENQWSLTIEEERIDRNIKISLKSLRVSPEKFNGVSQLRITIFATKMKYY